MTSCVDDGRRQVRIPCCHVITAVTAATEYEVQLHKLVQLSVHIVDFYVSQHYLFFVFYCCYRFLKRVQIKYVNSLFTRATLASAVLAMERRLAGWVGDWHTPVLCQNGWTRPILKLFRPSGSPSTVVFWPLAPVPNSKWNPVISPKTL